MERNELISYWLESAKQDSLTMDKLFQIEEYPWSLFLGQLVLEKVLKALYTQNVGKDAPRIHDLTRLALLAKVEVTTDALDHFDEISTFNLNTRYPDAKLAFYHKCTKEYSLHKLETIRSLYIWLLSLIDTN